MPLCTLIAGEAKYQPTTDTGHVALNPLFGSYTASPNVVRGSSALRDRLSGEQLAMAVPNHWVPPFE